MREFEIKFGTIFNRRPDGQELAICDVGEGDTFYHDFWMEDSLGRRIVRLAGGTEYIQRIHEILGQTTYEEFMLGLKLDWATQHSNRTIPEEIIRHYENHKNDSRVVRIEDSK